MKKYQIVYADPPWGYRNYNYAKTATGQRAKRGVVKEYPTLAVDEICNGRRLHYCLKPYVSSLLGDSRILLRRFVG